jgi:hypothetical protein
MGTVRALISMSKEWKEWVDSEYLDEKEPYKDARSFLFEISEIASQLMWDEKIENNPNFCWAVYEWFNSHEPQDEKMINDQINLWANLSVQNKCFIA